MNRFFYFTIYDLVANSQSFITYFWGYFYYICDFKSNIGHDLVILTLWEIFEIVPVMKMLQISASWIIYALPYHLIYRYAT